LVNKRPGGLVESNYLILNLSAPCALADTSWIKPGKAAWDWWSGSFARDVDFQPGMNTATMKHYVDFAAQHHLEYMLVDAGWSPGQDEYSHLANITQYKPEVDIPGIVAYAQRQGVRVMIWAHWASVKKYLDQAFPLYEKWGVAGVKIDFMNRDDQEMVNFYEETLRKAAEHHLVVDYHGAYKPTGLRRTYPNLLTREGVMGMEYSKVSDRVTPEHDVTIPFTRMLAGPMDYTPGCFHNATKEQFKPRFIEPRCQGTRAHQLAMYVVFESPLAMLADYPESYDAKAGVEFLEKVPTVWDDTRVLNGEPAKYVTIARQRGGAWYLGSMTNWDARDLTIPLDFLGPGEYAARVFADAADADKVATSLSVSAQRVKAGDKLDVHLAPGGGLAAVFAPVE
jgi:alpha-glucosidase